MHTTRYPTLARIALDILPIPGSSVSCEQLFSRAKQVTTDRRSRIAPDLIEALECLQYNWKGNIIDWARLNSRSVEEVDIDLDDFSLILKDEEELYAGDYEELYTEDHEELYADHEDFTN